MRALLIGQPPAFNPISGVNISFASSAADTLRKTVMICEDDPDLLQVYRLALRSKYDVVGVRSGKECVQTYSDMKHNGRKIDLLLLDYRLPDNTGDEIAIKVKQLDGTRVVLISAYEIDSEILDRLKHNGYITMFLKKPVTIQELGRALDNSLLM